MSAQRLIFAKLQLSKVRHKIGFISRLVTNHKYQLRTIEERHINFAHDFFLIKASVDTPAREIYNRKGKRHNGGNNFG